MDSGFNMLGRFQSDPSQTVDLQQGTHQGFLIMETDFLQLEGG